MGGSSAPLAEQDVLETAYEADVVGHGANRGEHAGKIAVAPGRVVSQQQRLARRRRSGPPAAP